MAGECQRKDNKGHWPLTSVCHGTTQDLSRSTALTPRSKIDLQKPKVAQMVKKFTFLLPMKLHTSSQETTTGLYPGPDEYTQHTRLTLILLTWTIWRAPTNASKWRMGFNSAFKGLTFIFKSEHSFQFFPQKKKP
jgi:hypothetical protein